MKLTIGLPHHNDYDGLYFTIQDIRKELLFNGCRTMLNEIEFMVVEDNCNEEHSKISKKLLQRDVIYHSRAALMSLVNNRGGPSSVKDIVIKRAMGDFVLVMDCHILLCPVVKIIHKLFQFIDENPDTNDLYTGPLVGQEMNQVHTHFNDKWGSHMWGTWGKAWGCHCGEHFSTIPGDDDKLEYVTLVEQKRVKRCIKCSREFPVMNFSGHEEKLKKEDYYLVGIDFDDEPFEIFAQGTGLFFTRRKAWLGFNSRCRGFGGEECYIHTKYRQAGRKTINLPFLRWLHRFDRPNGISYPLTLENKLRNYILEFAELGLDPSPIYENFTEYPKNKIDALFKEAESYYT